MEISNYGLHSMQYPILQTREAAVTPLKTNSFAIKHAAEEFKSNIEVVRAAITQSIGGFSMGARLFGQIAKWWVHLLLQILGCFSLQV